MNCQLSDVQVTMRNGQTKGLENAFVRGSQIRFFLLPDMLKNAPMFKVGGEGGVVLVELVSIIPI